MERKASLLLLEDEEHLAFTLEFNLMQEGYEVEVTSTLKAARVSLARGKFDVLIFDVMLPDGDAFSLCREIRLRNDLTPILFLTAKGSPDDIVTGLDAGGDDYITKPFSLKELLARLGALLRRTRWHQETETASSQKEGLTEYHFGGCTVNFVTHEVTVREKSVALTVLEMRLLRYFIERPCEVISRQDLLSGVWEIPSDVNTRTIDNFLVRLRRVFERDPANPRHFITVRGIGYRFLPE